MPKENDYLQKVALKLLVQAASDKLFASSSEMEDLIEKEKERLLAESPKKFAKFDHKDWKYASEDIIYYRGYKSAIDSIIDDMYSFLEKAGVSLHEEGDDEI